MEKKLNNLAIQLGYETVGEFFISECNDSIIWGICDSCGKCDKNIEPDGVHECECGGIYSSVLVIHNNIYGGN